MTVACDRCGAEFPYASRLARHLARKNPCASGDFACACGRRYLHERAMVAHSKKCEAARGPSPPAAGAVSNSHNTTTTSTTNTTNTNTSTTNTNTTINHEQNFIMVGWPPGWPAPARWPNPFNPEEMRVDPELIRRATERLAGLGDPEATVLAAAVMDVVKHLHAREAERNLYPDPARSDQALTFAEPGQWDAIPHTEARHRLVGRLLEDISKKTAGPRRGWHAAGEGARGADVVARAAAPAFASHLVNLGRQAAAGVVTPVTRKDCRLPRDPLRTWYFGDEAVVEITDDMMTSITQHLETCDLTRWAATPDAGAAAHAVLMYDRICRSPCAENQTAFEHGGVAWVWDMNAERNRGEWKAVEVAEAAAAMFLQAAYEFATTARVGPLGRGTLAEYEPLVAAADYLTLPEYDGGENVPKPVAAELAAGPAGLALFRRRSDRARAFYLGPVSPDRSGPCEVDCGCSRAAARRILRGER